MMTQGGTKCPYASCPYHAVVSRVRGSIPKSGGNIFQSPVLTGFLAGFCKNAIPQRQARAPRLFSVAVIAVKLGRLGGGNEILLLLGRVAAFA
jgi:hypothetical protein